jgi:hypothetical protein
MPQLYVILPVGGYEGGHPDQGLPGGPPGHVSNRPPGSWGGERPDQGLPPGHEHPWWGGRHWDRPDQGLPPGAEPRGTEVPPDVYTPTPIPEEIASQYVVSVYNPKTMQWTTKSYAPR